jgi:S1-C subfamily serine protease
MTEVRSGLLLISVLASLPAAAITPQELFSKLAPSIYFVYGVDTDEKRRSQGSGVVIAPQRVVTNCHVIQGANFVYLRKENVIYVAKRVEHADAGRDLCQLEVPNLNAPPVELGAAKGLQVGQKVFALGNPKGLEVTLSDGLVSALRGPDGKEQVIQTTAPISPGSSGGGLFDENGLLVGITTAQMRSGQNLNFAAPAEWVREIPERIKAAEEKKKLQVAAVGAGGATYRPASEKLPPVGATWKYRYTDLKYSRVQHQFTVRVDGVDGWVVSETFTPDGAAGRQRVRTDVGADEARFLERALGSDRTALEFNPYFVAYDGETRDLGPVTGYPMGPSSNAVWSTRTKVTRNVSLRVPAGSFSTTMVEIEGERAASTEIGRRGVDTGRFAVTVWYAPEVKRYVRLENRVWLGTSQLYGEERIDLVEVSGN